MALILLVSTSVEAQCAMCRAVLESEEGQSTAEGVNDGIVYLMAIPYILVAGIIFFIYKKLYTYSAKEIIVFRRADSVI